MTNHRYTQFMLPADRYVRRLTPKGKKLLVVAEGGLLLLLTTSVIFYAV